MNCFQKLLSSWWRTTVFFVRFFTERLWIAFKNYYLRDEGQPLPKYTKKRYCCELLSKIIIFVMKDNFIIIVISHSSVVNCFQKLLSSWWRTTKKVRLFKFRKLWIAFKNYYLRDEGQHRNLMKDEKFSCELLSKIIIFVMKDNLTHLFPFAY